MKKERMSNIELLRIIAMLCIISFHYFVKSGYVVEDLTLKNYILNSFWFLGELGENLFILISGYFLIKHKFSIKKLIYLLLEILFYELLSKTIAYLLHYQAPFLTLKITYWYMRSYLIIYILSPYINHLIETLPQKKFKQLIIISIWIWSIFPTFLGIFENSTEYPDYYSRLTWFLIMYFIGSYIRLYDTKLWKKKKTCIITSVICFSFLFLSIAGIYIVRKTIPTLSNLNLVYLWGPNNIVMLILSISLFCLFKKLTIKKSIILNTLASTTLGIYMLHDGYLNPILWQKLFRSKTVIENTKTGIPIILSILSVFFLGSIIDLIRQILEKKIITKGIQSKKFTKFQEKVKEIEKNIT